MKITCKTDVNLLKKRRIGVEVMKQTIDDAVYRSFLNAFQLFSEPVRLAESELYDSCLVTNLRDTRPDLLPHQALKQVFAETLNVLKEEQSESADLLRGRFWEGLQIEEMVAIDRPRPMGKRSFSNHQRDAIHAFAFLFQQQEANCVAQSVAAESILVGQSNVADGVEKKETGRPDRNPAYMWWVAPLVLLVLIGSRIGMQLNRPATWQTDSLGVIETVEDRIRGEVFRLQGVGNENSFDSFNWSGTDDEFNVAWMQKGEDYSAVYVHVDSSNGFREFKFVPEDDAPTFKDERYQVGVGVDGRDGAWHLHEYDLQAIAADLEPDITLDKLRSFTIKTSGEVWVDDVQFSTGSPPSVAPATLLQDGASYSNEMTNGMIHYYKISVPDNASKLTVTLGEMTADLDLYVRRNVRPSGNETEGGIYDCHSAINGLQNDVCVLNQVRGSIWYIAVQGGRFEEVGTYTLNADYAQPDDTGQSAWVRDGNGTITPETDAEQGAVTHLQGIGDENTFDQFRLLTAVGATAFNVSWEMKAADYVVIYIEVDTLNGERVFKFSPDDKAAVFTDGNRYKIGTPSTNRTGEWHTYSYDLQGIAAELETGIVLREVTGFYIGSSGKVWVRDVSFRGN